MAEYSEAFAAFILECRDAWNDVNARIDRGDVLAGKAVTVRIRIPPMVVDQMRQDRLAVLANGGSNGKP